MLRLKVRLERIDRKYHIDTIAIAISGFIGIEPEVLIPQTLVKDLKLSEVCEPETTIKILGDGREIQLLKYRNSVNVYVLTEDRIEGPITCSVVVSPYLRYVLLNDKLLGLLKIVLLDFAEGIWCFRDELGKRERRSY